MRFFFFFNDTATTEIYTLSLHDALPILAEDHRHPRLRHQRREPAPLLQRPGGVVDVRELDPVEPFERRSEEHTSELQSRVDLVCRLLLEKKKKTESTETHLVEKVSAAIY